MGNEGRKRYAANKDSPETLSLSSNGEIEHRINPIVDRNAHPLVGPLECVRVETIVISGAFLALPAIDHCHDCAHWGVIERRANVVHTLPLVLDAVPPSLHDLVTRKGNPDDQYG